MLSRTFNVSGFLEKVKPDTLTDYLKRLPVGHPERLAYDKATAPGKPRSGYPRTVEQLQALAK